MPNNILITPGSASIQFSGSSANTIRLQVENSGSIAFYGSSGSLFGITDSLSGSLMSVNDISGLPILEVFSDDRVVMGTFNRNTLVVTGSRVGIDKATPTADLDVSGSVFVTGSITISSGTLVGSASFASRAITASYAIAGGSGGGASFPYTGSAIISGSLSVTGSTVNSGSVLVTGDLTLTNASQPVLNYTLGANSALVRLSTTDFRLGSISNQTVSFLQNSAVAWYIDTTKHLLPNVNNTYEIGATGQRVKTIWTNAISSSLPIATASFALSYAAPTQLTGSIWASGSIQPVFRATGLAALQGVLETVFVTGSSVTGSMNIDILTSTVWFFTGSSAANFKLNFRGNSSTTLNSLMSTGQSLTVAVINTNGASTHYNSGSDAQQVDGTVVTVRWQNAAPSTGNSGSLDTYSYTIIKTANAAFTVLGSQTRFG